MATLKAPFLHLIILCISIFKLLKASRKLIEKILKEKSFFKCCIWGEFKGRNL